MRYLIIKCITPEGVRYITSFDVRTGKFKLTEDINEALHYDSLSSNKFFAVLLNACSEFPTVEVMKSRG